MTKNINTKITYEKGSSVRVSTVEIDDAIKELENAFTDGRLDDAELEDRMAKALKAKTEGDLSELVNDLARIERAIAPAPATHTLRRLGKNGTVAIFSGVEQIGHFILPKSYHVTAVFGGCLLDLSKARLESPNSTIEVEAIFGGVQIFVPPGVRVEIQSTPIFGGISKKLNDDHLPPDAPVINIHATAVFGGIEIKIKE